MPKPKQASAFCFLMSRPLFERMRDERSLLERLVQKIPGYKGYKERDRKRSADKILRETLANRLDNLRRSLQTQLSPKKSESLEGKDDMDRAIRRLEHISDALRRSDYGYAGLFADAKINDERLSALYGWDEKLLGRVEELESKLSKGDEVGVVEKWAADFLEALRQRKEVARGLKEE